MMSRKRVSKHIQSSVVKIVLKSQIRSQTLLHIRLMKELKKGYSPPALKRIITTEAKILCIKG